MRGILRPAALAAALMLGGAWGMAEASGVIGGGSPCLAAAPAQIEGDLPHELGQRALCCCRSGNNTCCNYAIVCPGYIPGCFCY